LYVACLNFEAYSVQNDRPGPEGILLLTLGFTPLPASVASLAWLANPLLIVAWILIWNGTDKLSVVFAVLSFLFAGGFIFMRRIVGSEALIAQEITGLGPGYWLWLASTTVACAAAAMCWIEKDSAEATP